MVEILQLSRKPAYPPKNGRQRRVWEEAKKFSEHGTVWLATPQESVTYPVESIRHIPIRSRILEQKVVMIYLWSVSHSLGLANPYHKLLTAQILSNIKKDFDSLDIVACDSPQVVSAAAQIARSNNASMFLSKHNSYFEILDDFLETSIVPKILQERAARNLRCLEQKGIELADVVVFHSEEDQTNFKIPSDTTSELVSNGTNADEIRDGGNPEAVLESLSFEAEDFICIFLGSYDYFPNKEAANTIDQEIAPAVPSVKFVLVGQNPPETTSENVHAVGYINDLPGLLAISDVALCPIYSGSGTKLKVLDYLAAGLPIVTTEKGASGIQLVDGESAIIRNTPEEFADSIQELKESSRLRSEISKNANDLADRYTWKSLLSKYDPLIEKIA